jgi:hypothetical protein
MPEYNFDMLSMLIDYWFSYEYVSELQLEEGAAEGTAFYAYRQPN